MTAHEPRIDCIERDIVVADRHIDRHATGSTSSTAHPKARHDSA
jgi:hypothetical protein